MRRWMRRSSPAAPAQSVPAAPPAAVVCAGGGALAPAFASDPATWEEAFDSHWRQAEAIMRASSDPYVTTLDHVVAVFRHLDQMLWLLLTEVNSQPEPEIGPILDRFFTDNIFMEVLQWSLPVPFLLAPACQVHLLRLFEGIVTQSHTPHHCLLVHKPILIPLLRLLEWCSAGAQQTSATTKLGATEVEKHFVLLLNQICTKMAEDATLLEFFFNGKPAGGDPVDKSSNGRFLVFTLMIAYLYESGDIGQLARDALLLVLAVSRKHDSVALFVSQSSNFCPVLAAGLSGCFSQLPRRVGVELLAGDDWYGVTPRDIENDGAVQEFYSSLLFCNAVVQVCHRFVLHDLLDLIYHGFLVSVVKPALFESSMEELISATAYLELCLRTITEPSLIKVFVRFLLVETEGEKRVLETLVDRISSPSRLSLVSLRLFSTMVQLNCEDLMLELVYKYLIPCTHVLPSQLDHIGQVDYFGQSAERFLSLVPQCCLVGADKADSDTSANQLDVSSAHSDFSNDGYDMNHTYSVYLKEARQRICQNLKGTRNWKWPYDAHTPDPAAFRDQDPEGVMDEADGSTTDDARALRRQSSIRRSTTTGGVVRPNQYFASRRHTSSVTVGGGVQHGATLVDLSVLGPDFLLPLEDDEYEDEFWSGGDTAGGGGETSPPFDDTSTPRYTKSAAASKSATDYFKFAYDEDAHSAGGSGYRGGASSAGEESDGAATTSSNSVGGATTTSGEGGGTTASSYVLRGWDEVKDLDMFIEVLNRVRTSKDAANHSLSDNLDFIDQKMALITGGANGDGAVANAVEGQESSFLMSKDSGVEMGVSLDASTLAASERSVTPMDESAVGANRSHFQEVALPLEIRGSFASPNLGPFLTCVLGRLENMIDNTLFVNLQLTGLVSLLASYTQPLLSSLLLSSTLVFQPTVPSLFQIVSSLKNKIDSHAFSVDNFESLLLRGRRFLNGRERRSGKAPFPTNRAASQPSPFSALEMQGFTNGPPASSGGSRRSDGAGGGKPRSISDILVPKNNTTVIRDVDTKPRADSHDTALSPQKGYKYYTHKAMESQSATLEAMRTKSVVYSTLILQEFLQELAATAHELPLAHLEIEPRDYL